MKIEAFVLYGERNTGTNFLETIIYGRSIHLKRHTPAFNLPLINGSRPKNSVKLRPDRHLYNFKHFFGYDQDQIKKADNVLFVCAIRNPYNWIMALNKSRHHIPKENQPINKFITNEWYSIRPKTGEEIIQDRDFDTNLRYKNIFAMRSKKARYLYHTMPTLVKNYEFVKYEDLCNDPIGIITKWSKKYDLTLNTDIIKPHAKVPYKIKPNIKTMIDLGIDWEIEQAIGYNPDQFT